MDIEQLTRSETKLILEGLDAVRQRMRLDTSVDLRDPEYRGLLNLQAKLIQHLENLPY